MLVGGVHVAPQDGTEQGAACVLVADDEDLVREALAQGLEDRSYAALPARSAAAALMLLLDAGAGVDVLLTDFAMPGTDRLTLIAVARAAGGAADRQRQRRGRGLAGAGRRAFSLLTKLWRQKDSQSRSERR